MIRSEAQMKTDMERVRENARAKAIAHIIPDYAERFPEQFEDAVEAIAAHEIRLMNKSSGG